jgi:hypothetical protein
MTSLFSTIVRYLPTLRRNPREDMLTQCLAATLEHARGLPEFVVSDWLEGRGFPPRAGLEVDVDSQYRLPRTGDRVDLTLAFREAGERVPSVLIWVEIKHQAHLSGRDQLERYERQLSDQVARVKRLVLLAPAGYIPRDDERIPTAAILADWHRLGLILRRWLDSDRPEDARAEWIATEFLSYLEEEDLYVSKPLTTLQVEVLRGHEAANRTFAALAEHAGRQIDDWIEAGGIQREEADQGPRRGSHGWTGFWRSYGYREYAGTRAWFEWNFQTPSGQDEPCFGSGVAFSPDEEPAQAVWEALMEQGLGRTADGDPWPRAFRYLTPEELATAADGTLTGQAQILAEWVLDSFRAGRQALGLRSPVP